MSYVHGASATPLFGSTVGSWLRTACSRWSTSPALIIPHQNIRWSYHDLENHVNRCARGLLGLGLRPGDRVGVWSPNRYEWVVTQYATALLGCVLVNVNPSYRPKELQYALNKVGCKALIMAPGYKQIDYEKTLSDVIANVTSVENIITMHQSSDHFRNAMQNRKVVDFLDIMSTSTSSNAAAGVLKSIEDSIQFDDAVNIQFTSGTTGSPKGATLTHHNILNNGYFVGERMKLTHSDKVCIPVPLYHCFGMVLGNMACVTHGAAMVYPGEVFDPQATLQAVSEEACTALHGVPTMFIAELEHPKFPEYNLSTLRTGIMAGSICPADTMQKVIQKMHMKEVTICYGMTETSPVSFQTTCEDSAERRVHTVGTVHPHVEVKIVDRENRIVPRGVSGELCTRGYVVMKGYWGDEAKTKECLTEDGWLHTGDLGVIDADGYCRIVGRIKDMIIRGGENIYPSEVEDVLLRHKDVENAQVIGIHDEKYGEEICAWVKLKRGAQHCTVEELKRHCKHEMASYKCPRIFRFVDDFPMTVTGKIQKFIMREMMEKGPEGK